MPLSGAFFLLTEGQKNPFFSLAEGTCSTQRITAFTPVVGIVVKKGILACPYVYKMYITALYTGGMHILYAVKAFQWPASGFEEVVERIMD